MSASDLMLLRLRCGYKVSPLAVGPGRVRFSPELLGSGTGRQRAYEIVLHRSANDRSADRDHGALGWTAGRAESCCSANIGYGGPALAPGSVYARVVRGFGTKGVAGAMEPASTVWAALGGLWVWTADLARLALGGQTFYAPSGDGLADPVLLARKKCAARTVGGRLEWPRTRAR